MKCVVVLSIKPLNLNKCFRIQKSFYRSIYSINVQTVYKLYIKKTKSKKRKEKTRLNISKSKYHENELFYWK